MQQLGLQLSVSKLVQGRTHSYQGGYAGVSFLYEVHLEEGAAVVLVVRPQQRLQDDVIGGNAPGMQVADQCLHKVNISIVTLVLSTLCKAGCTSQRAKSMIEMPDLS